MLFEEYLELLSELSPDAIPEWGKFSSQEMVEHLILVFKASSGSFKLECYSPEEKLAVLKKILMSDRDLPKNFQNPVLPADPEKCIYNSISEAVSNLKNEINNFEEFFIKYPDARVMHVTFGDLNFEEWVQFHKKHFRHHLQQFGLK